MGYVGFPSETLSVDVKDFFGHDLSVLLYRNVNRSVVVQTLLNSVLGIFIADLEVSTSASCTDTLLNRSIARDPKVFHARTGLFCHLRLLSPHESTRTVVCSLAILL
jgi:hypothetical protein